ncbi:MAG: hypothetical protein V5804_03940 [Mucilaginibacter sp.]|uniref:hypothetical protein n=1 Tax=Mucilaginibacter sp. TaxID=1882438 RepID=UPI0034E52C6C
MYDKNGRSYDIITTAKIETIIDVSKKYKEKPPLYVNSVEILPPTVGDLTKDEILKFLSTDPLHNIKHNVLIARSPYIEKEHQINGSKYFMFLSQTLEQMISEVRKHQETPIFADRIDALPTSYPITATDFDHSVGSFTFPQFKYSSYIYLLLYSKV